MKALSNVAKLIILAVVAVVLIIIAIVLVNANHPQITANDTPVALTPSSSPQTSTVAKSPATHVSAPIVKSPTPPVISIITPVGNDVWKIGTQNVISWNKAGGISGSISLINASNQTFAGVILPEIGPNQTSYTWNTVSVSLNRTNPSGKDVTPGLYEIELTYDGNNIKPVTSFPFSIIN